MDPAARGPAAASQAEDITGMFLKLGKIKAVLFSAAMIAPIAVADWYVGPRMSLGVLYVFPMMVAATVLNPFETIALAFVCSLLRSWFDLPSPPVEVALRFVFAVIAYALSGLMVTALIRNREQAVQHLARIRCEQQIRRDLEQQLEVLIESSPAGILTMDGAGNVLACNKAADALFGMPVGESLQSRSIAAYVPLLADAISFDSGPDGLRTAAQCQGCKQNGEIFLAHCWFSSYLTSGGVRLAAIIVDSSEEMRDREEEGLRQLMRGNRIAATAVSHEIRNMCSAISVVSDNLSARRNLAGDVDFNGLRSLVSGLEKIAATYVHSGTQEELGHVGLQAVLDDLRIVIEQNWRDIGGTVVWNLPKQLPVVLGERHGLLQAFLNIAQNSHRAVRTMPKKTLAISLTAEERSVCVRFRDTGPGIPDASRLFEPFQSGADGAGMGLYVSRAVVRSYGGDLRFEPEPSGACFCIEIMYP